MREEQVQNAVKFLSHPKVQGSPVIYRRSFLERKGLTKEEIDEAFRRVPDPATSAQAPATNTDAQVKSTSNPQPLPSAQALPSASTASAGGLSPVATLAQPRFHWTHAVFAIGLLAVSGAGTAIIVKNTIIPRLKSWIRRIASEEENEENTHLKPSSAEEAASAAKAAASAAAEVARASQEMLSCKIEEKKYFGDLVNLLDVQLREMKLMNDAIRKLEGHANTSSSLSSFNQEDNRDRMTGTRPTYHKGKSEYDSRPVSSTSPPKPTQLSGPPHPQSYMEIMAMVQRGERPPNVRDIDDSPPDPNRPISNPRMAPRAKPWEAGQTPNNTGYSHQQPSNEGDWNYYAAENGFASQTNGGGSVPWRQKKNVRITELDQDDELKASKYSSQWSEQAARSTWVPPQPPPIAMPEAAEAIRRPKATAQKELTDDQLMARTFEMSEESQKVAEISEYGGAVDALGSGMQTGSSSETREGPESN
ncbi:hypothetical protein MLD38_032022 [Melastoma candidum]|uniref:Uncharacterized protein n=1 Tax=Melastoma candidum TaxID=119954 RepID=A0ACB9MQZ3_9MYRT|nr:hypothetical protein MLD38_032022 [Melastoma candidum]